MENVTKLPDISAISPGVKYIADGYIDYSREVICGRALADIRDGLKPVNRRILYTLSTGKSKAMTKCARISGNVLAYHPHGEGSVYEALVLMTDRNGSLAFPTIEGQGSFGGVYKTDKAAAMRYTEARLHSNAEEYFGDMNGIKMIPNFDSTTTEPEVLPVTFPAVLVNSTSGIAVGFRANIPSFNFVDVCNLVKEYIENGECKTVIAPDFVTGGYYVKNNKELQKLMRYGTGKIKLRGRATSVNNEIQVTEVPFGKTIQGLLKQIDSANISTIRSTMDADDSSKDLKFIVYCKNKSVVDETLYAIYKNTDFQYTYSAAITVIDGGVPKTLGVWQIIEKWVEWRRSVIEKEYKFRLEGLYASVAESRAFMEIVKHKELKEQLVNIVTKEGKKAGVDFILANYDNTIITPELAEWCVNRRLTDFTSGGAHEANYNKALIGITSVENVLNNIDAEIVRQMNNLIATYGRNHKRRTEVTTTDYEFIDSVEESVKQKDTSPCAYDFKNGFLRKLRSKPPVATSTAEFLFDGTASDTLIAFDNRGRILRIYCEDMPFSAGADMGVYLQRYFGLMNESDDYKITWVGRMAGQKLMLLYKDGNVGFVDTAEWMENSRNVKVLEKGISAMSADSLGLVVEYTDEIANSMLFVTDESGRAGWVYPKELKQKDRTARTRAFTLYKNTPIDSYFFCDVVKGQLLFNNMSDLHGYMRKFNIADFRGNVEDFKPF